MAANQAAEPSADLLLESRESPRPESGASPPDSGDRGDDDPEPDTNPDVPGAHSAGTDQPQLDLGIPNLAELELVSAGSATSVYRAVQLEPRRPVAVKVLHADLASDVGRRFDRERAVSAELSGHSAVVPLLEAGKTAAGQPYAVSPFYGRGSLARLVADHGRLGWREATFLLEPVAVALAELHGRGLVHRALDPERILFTDFLLPRVSGFGLSLPEGERSSSATLIPSLFFSAPELAVPIEADPRADVYSLGAILFAMVTGHVGFAGDAALLTARTATAQARTGKGAAAAVLPDALRDLVGRAMAEDPRDRPANAAAFVSELRRAVARPHDADTGPAGLQIDVRREPAVETATSASATMGPVDLASPATARPATDLLTAEPGAATGPVRFDGRPFDGEAFDSETLGLAELPFDDLPLDDLPLEGGARIERGQPVSVDALLGEIADDDTPPSAMGDLSLAQSAAQAAQTDARYVLALAAIITAAIMAMVAAAMMAVG